MSLFNHSRSLCVNEFASGAYDEIQQNGLTTGENILARFGMVFNGEPYNFEWVWYGVAFALGTGLLATQLSVLFLSTVRFQTGKSLATDQGEADEEPVEEEAVVIPFTRTNLTFKDIRYTVTASTSKEKLELLKGIDGVSESGRMTALMVNT